MEAAQRRQNYRNYSQENEKKTKTLAGVGQGKEPCIPAGLVSMAGRLLFCSSRDKQAMAALSRSWEDDDQGSRMKQDG